VPFGPHVIALVEDALSECIKYHDALDAFLLRSGVPKARLQAARTQAEERSKGRFSRAPKRFVVQEVLNEMTTTATGEGDRVISDMITGLCKGSFPQASVSGQSARDNLIALRLADRNEKAEEAQARAEEQRRKQRAEELERESAARQRAALQQGFNSTFLQLCAQDDAQARGYMLEKFLNDLFAFEGLDPRASFRLVGEQIDGSFTWAGRTHLVEAKWVGTPVGGSSFGSLMYKIEGKSADTRGLFISINGYSQEALRGLKQKGELRFVCIDGAHLIRCLEPGGSFVALLERVWRHAGETGEPYFPVAEMSR
jgi:hypothetical protein